MKIKLYQTVLLVLAMLGATSCNGDSGRDDGISMYVTKGLYILNEGIGFDVPGSVAYYDIASTKILANDIFQTSNGESVGYQPSDMCVYGAHCYIAAGGNQALYVTDSLCTIQKTIALDNRTPVAVTGYGGRVYVTYAEGYLGQIDTASFNVTQVAVGASPAGVAGAGNKIYVANSGSANTVTVVDHKNMTVLGEIEVGVNPRHLMADYYGDVYAIALGDAQNPSSFWRIASTDDRALRIPSVINPVNMALSVEDRMAILRKTDDGKYEIDLFDTIAEEMDCRFLQGTSLSDDISAIGTDVINGYVYLGVANGGALGKVLVYSYYGRKIAELPEIGRMPKAICSRYELITVPVR